ncbi:putative chorismate synthase [Helianthus debilis subsp. tardiflorus]
MKLLCLSTCAGLIRTLEYPHPPFEWRGSQTDNLKVLQIAKSKRRVKIGLGSPIFYKLEAELAKAAFSLPAIKGFDLVVDLQE